MSEHSIVQDFTKQVFVQLHLLSVDGQNRPVTRFLFLLQKYPEHAVYKVLHLMLRRGELQHRMQRKVLYRVK